ncbi:MAG: UDP-N-acetylmuramoylalanyl-D-glutamyl-2, 6-diaminopimelate--D-alanyl-D-alanine ligase [Chloroflexi bacterium HGW-Chloroflexi-1]|nr:MAG: UDP-N-acetylmuramoylalanyl-D-glutamyl-2, 6-diaminopimelate--D-alanyl-D-alanine ligase [Chloroflexi bacterium HGW-Chloroflexi-1]
MLKFADVWQGLIGVSEAVPASLADQPITAVVIDSRAAQPGALFVALRGEKTDGHLYLSDAFARGAVAAIAEPRGVADCRLPIADCWIVECSGPYPEISKFEIRNSKCVFVVPDSLATLQKLSAHWRAQMSAEVIAITGSVGKTTTKEIVANVLAQRYATLRSEGNLNNEIGLPLTLLRLTPEHRRVVLEMGMYTVGEIAHLCEMARPRIGVVTNVGPSHLARLGSIERIAQAKAELVQALPPAEQGGVAILNTDEPLVRGMAGLTRARVFTYGLNPASDLWADEIASQGLEGIRFRCHYGREAFHLRLPLLGRHSVHTALRGAAVGLVDGLSWTEIIAGLQEVRGQLRILVVPGLHGATLIDDTYNASPASMLAALNLMEDIASADHRSIAVLGDMFELGTYEEQGHRLVGGRAAQVIDKLITVGPRARWIAEEARANGMKPACVHPTDSNADAIAVLQGLIRPGDVILVKGSRAAAMDTIVDTLSRPQ